MEFSATSKSRRRLVRVASASTGALLALFGVAPLISTALADIAPAMGGHPFLFAAIAVVGGVFSMLTVNKAIARRGRGVAAPFGRLFVATMIATGLAAMFLSWEGDNLTSWRMAERLQAGPGVVKNRTSTHGTQLLQLGVTDSDESDRLLGSIRLPWHLSVSGGIVDIAVRSDGGTKQGDCLASVTGNVVALDVGCGQWSLSRVAVPAGTETLVLRALGRPQLAGTIELGINKASANFGTAWALLGWVAFSLLLSCIVYVTRDVSANAQPRAKTTQPWRSQWTYWAAASVILFIVLANAGTGAFVTSERTIYAWDFGGHWMSAVTVSRAIGKSEPSEPTQGTDATSDAPQAVVEGGAEPFWARPSALASVLRSIRYWEYNVSAAIPLAIPMSFADGSRLSYELSMVNVYVVPAVVVLMLVLWTVTREQQSRLPVYWPLIPAIAILMFNPFWVPLLRGYIGVCVVVVNLLVYWLYLRRDVNEQRIAELLLISGLLAVGVILRRWNAYWVVSFFLVASLDAMMAVARSQQFSLRNLVRSFSGLFVIGLGALAILSVVAWPLVVTMLTTDYGDIYSAYADSGGSLGGHVGHFVRTFGVGLIAFTLIAIGYLLWNRRYRRLALLLTIQLATMIVHVSSTQEMGPHHMYLLMPAVLVLLGLAIQDALAGTAVLVRACAVILSIAFLANGIVSHVAVFAPGGDAVRQAMVPVVPDNRRTPLVRNDIDEFGRLASYLDSQVARLGPAARIYVLASSPVFNVATLDMLEVSTGIPFASKERLLRTADVDKRDGFPRGLFDAAIVAVASPVQFHHLPEEQQVIGIPAEMVLSTTGIGKAFKALPESFSLDDGVQVHVYQRTREIAPNERNELSRRLRSAYPGRPFIYRP